MAVASTSTAPLGSLAGGTIPPPPGAIPRPPGKAANDAGASSEPDARLVEETRQQIRHLIHEITQLAQSDMTIGEFYDAFLQRVVSALAAVGGAVWHVDDDGRLELQYQINLPATGITSGSPAALRHAKLLKRVIGDGRPELIAPQSGDGGLEGGNPTDCLLVVGVLVVDQKIRGLVEVFQRPGAGPSTQRGYLRFLSQMCDLASDYLKNRELRALGEEQTWSRQLDAFLRAVHRSLDRDTTAFTIANEGRRLIGCDRVSVGLLRGGSCELIAVSGLASVDSRATTVARLQELCAIAAAAEEPLWYSGETQDLAPQVETAIGAYVDASHSHTIAILPLRAAAPEQGDASRPVQGAIVGVLIAEQIQAGKVGEEFQPRVLSVVEAAGPAMANAQEHSGIFLLPIWKLLGAIFSIFDSERLPRTVSVIGLVAAVVLALAVIPWSFEVQANGSLHPEIERDIFAGIDGEVTDILVDHLSEVQAGAELVKMRNNDLAVGMQNLIGQRATIAEQILALQRRIIEGRRTDPEEQNRLTGELAQLKKNDESLRQQIELYKQKEEQLVVRSPIRGQIITWQLRELLMQRPVVRGQVLLTVVDPTGKWDLHIDMPESKLGYVAQAAKQSDVPLLVTFVLATHPGQEFQARVTEVHALADAGNSGSSTVRIRAAIDAAKLPELRPGAQVVARVSCGKRPLGYVLFHDVISFVQGQWLSWF